MLTILFLIEGADDKHATEANTKGVVGHTGISMPIAPKHRNRIPSTVRKMAFKLNF